MEPTKERVHARVHTSLISYLQAFYLKLSDVVEQVWTMFVESRTSFTSLDPMCCQFIMSGDTSNNVQLACHGSRETF